MKRKWFYPRLAAQSMRKNRIIYLPYLLMSMLMVAVFYIMCYMCVPETIIAMGVGETAMSVMGLGKIVVGVFAAIFLYYCSTFLLGRRMKEFGLYNVLGMGKGNITQIMLWDTLLTLLLALAGGLIAGISLARAAELLMIRIMDAQIATSISISPTSILYTVEVFGCIYAFILLVNMLRLRLSNPMALLRSENAGEKPPKANWIIAILGVVLLAVGYYMAVTVDDPITAILLFFVAVLAVIAGTYLLFMAGSVTLCRLLQKNKKYYYKTNHFISLSSMAFRMKRNGAGLATICILCTMVLVTLSSTLCLYIGTEDMLNITYPRDMLVNLERQGDSDFSAEDEKKLIDVVCSVVEKDGFDVSNLQALKTYSLTGYIQGGSFRYEADMNFATTKAVVICVYPLSDYELLTGKQVELQNGELLTYTLNGDFCGESLSVGDAEFNLKRIDSVPELFRSPHYRNAYDCILLFAEDYDATRESMLPYAKSTNAEMTNSIYIYFDTSAENDQIVDLKPKIVWHLDSEKGKLFGTDYCFIMVKDHYSASEEIYGLYGGLFFIGLILGSVFSLAAVLIIYYKQISEGYEDAGRFALMRKVGLQDSEIHRSINSQVLTVFFAPLLMAGLHVLLAMPMIGLMLRSLGMHNATLFYSVMGICFVAFALIYSAVYFITSRTYYRIVR